MTTIWQLDRASAVAPDFAIAPQRAPGDMGRIRASGFRTAIDPRPPFEGGPGQPRSADLEAAAMAEGVDLPSSADSPIGPCGRGAPPEGAPRRCLPRAGAGVLPYRTAGSAPPSQGQGAVLSETPDGKVRMPRSRLPAWRWTHRHEHALRDVLPVRVATILPEETADRAGSTHETPWAARARSGHLEAT